MTRPIASVAIVATALTVVLTACATPKATIRTNAIPGASPASFGTYAFADHPGTDRGGVSTPLTAYFKDAIRRELDARGYQYKEGGAELLVNFNANARENVDIESTPGASVGYYGYRGMYGYGYGTGAPEVETVRYRVGTANVDIVDTSKRQLIWEGIAEGRLTDKVMKDPAAAVNKVITEMFKEFPARGGAAVQQPPPAT